MQWNYFDPLFEAEEQLNDIESPWGGHRCFAYDLISNLKPQIVVELGTYKGTSFFAFCQAVKDQKLECSLFAVDSWTGDPHSSFYDEDIFNLASEIRKKYYSGLKIKFLRTDFDKAVKNFSDHSIDILHIDGYHTYEAVSNDFNRWYDKVKNNGIILFHDTHEKREDFGVYKFWDELKTKHDTIEFSHSHGLGVLFKSSGLLKNALEFQDAWRKYYSLQDISRRSGHIKNQEIRLLNKTIADLEKDKIHLYKTLNEKENGIRENENNIQEKLNIIKEKDAIIQGKDQIIREQGNSIQEKEKIIQEKDQIIREQGNSIQEKEKIIQEKDQVVREKENSIQEKLKQIQEKEKIIKEKEKSIQEKEKIIQEKSNLIKEKEMIIQEKDQMILEQENSIHEKLNILQEQKNLIRDKEIQIQEQAEMISALYTSWYWKITYPLRKIISLFSTRIKRD